MVRLDKKDKKILAELDFNARASLSELSKKIKLSKQVIKYRLDELIRKKVIKGFYALIDIFKLGYGCYQIFLKFQNITEKKEKEIINHICKIKEVKQVTTIGGDWDIIFVVWTKNLAALEKLMNGIGVRFGKYIFNKHVSIPTMFSYFRHKFAYDAEDFPSITIAVQKEIINLDKIDQALVNMLNKEGRLLNIQLSRKLRVSPATIQKRIQKLISKEVIKGFRLQLNESSLDFFHYRLFIRLKSLNIKRINALIDYLRTHKNILSVAKAIEKTDLEINLFVQNPRGFYNFINELKYNFPDLFKDYTWYTFYEIL